MQYRTEFAVDNKWYSNALRFEFPELAVTEAHNRFLRWTVPAAWRVVTDDTAEKQPYLGSRTSEDPTSFKVTDAAGQEVEVGTP